MAIEGSYGVYERNKYLNSVPLRLTFGTPIRMEDLPPENRKLFLAEETQRIIAAALAATPTPA
jgi:1-acyl-sn-glycerol-3-phosphate acyltransferase